MQQKPLELKSNIINTHLTLSRQLKLVMSVALRAAQKKQLSRNQQKIKLVIYTSYSYFL